MDSLKPINKSLTDRIHKNIDKSGIVLADSLIFRKFNGHKEPYRYVPFTPDGPPCYLTGPGGTNSI